MRHNALLCILILAAAAILGGCSRDRALKQHSDEDHVAASQPMSMPSPEAHVHGYGEVQLDPQRAQLMGVTTQKLAFRRFTQTIRTVGIVEIDETRVAPAAQLCHRIIQQETKMKHRCDFRWYPIGKP